MSASVLARPQSIGGYLTVVGISAGDPEAVDGVIGELDAVYVLCVLVAEEPGNHHSQGKAVDEGQGVTCYAVG